MMNSMLVCREWKNIVTDYIERLTLDALHDIRVKRQLQTFIWMVHENITRNKRMLNVSPHGRIELRQQTYLQLPQDLKRLVARCWTKMNYKLRPLLVSMLDNFMTSYSVYQGACHMFGCPIESNLEFTNLSSLLVLFMAAMVHIFPPGNSEKEDPLEQIIRHRLNMSDQKLVNTVVCNATLLTYMSLKLPKELVVWKKNDGRC